MIRLQDPAGFHNFDIKWTVSTTTERESIFPLFGFTVFKHACFHTSLSALLCRISSLRGEEETDSQEGPQKPEWRLQKLRPHPFLKKKIDLH